MGKCPFWIIFPSFLFGTISVWFYLNYTLLLCYITSWEVGSLNASPMRLDMFAQKRNREVVLLLTEDILINPYKAGFHARKSKLRIRHEEGDTVSCLLTDVEDGPFWKVFTWDCIFREETLILVRITRWNTTECVVQSVWGDYGGAFWHSHLWLIMVHHPIPFV